MPLVMPGGSDRPFQRQKASTITGMLSPPDNMLARFFQLVKRNAFTIFARARIWR
jgi:hypothetical protein